MDANRKHLLRMLFDSETMVFGKEPFMFFLDMEISKAIRYQNYLSLLLVRVEPGKHQARHIREQIKKLASILTTEVRRTDIIGRLDRDKLSVILLNADRSACRIVKDRVAATLQDYRLPSSLALACFPSDSTDANNLLKRALAHLHSQ